MNTAEVLDKLCVETHESNRKAGWWDQEFNPLVVPTKLALIVSECAEALHGHRQNLKDDKLPQYDMIAVELADVLIRTLDLAGFLGIPLGTIMEEKNKFNSQRKDHQTTSRAALNGKKY
jgi:NTP pyrophosphatase (non-canonical NTP hydrolase)